MHGRIILWRATISTHSSIIIPHQEYNKASSLGMLHITKNSGSIALRHYVTKGSVHRKHTMHNFTKYCHSKFAISLKNKKSISHPLSL